MCHWFSCSFNTFFFLLKILLILSILSSFTFLLNAVETFDHFFLFSWILCERIFHFLIVLDFMAKLLNEVWNGSWSKWEWFISKFFIYFLTRRFLFLSFLLCSSLASLFNFNNNLACSFLKTSFFNTLQRSSLCNVYNSCSLCFSFHLFHSHRRSWTTGTRNQTILKFSFFEQCAQPKKTHLTHKQV